MFRSCNLAILGGGLSGSLIALAMARHRPDVSLTLIEGGPSLGGNHVWSFFDSDIAPDHRVMLEPLIERRWAAYDVYFPGHSRQLTTPYASVTSTRLDATVRAALPANALLFGARVESVTPHCVTLGDGSTIQADAVIDARGRRVLPHMTGGWQKFLGQRLRLSIPHGLDRPIIMDARVDQLDGYRFVYVLPFSPKEAFIEDTYYADTPELDMPLLRSRIADYATAQGWPVEDIVYEESGVLPVIADGDFERFWASCDDPALARAGVRAALLHPLTSYSLPEAVRFANYLTTLDNLTSESLGWVSYKWAANHWRGGRYYRMLTRMLFSAARPDMRWRMLERFYRLPQPMIERFYAGRATGTDRLRMFGGKPPVPVGAALATLAGGGRPLADLGAPR